MTSTGPADRPAKQLLGVEAGRLGFLAGRIEKKTYGSVSSVGAGIVS